MFGYSSNPWYGGNRCLETGSRIRLVSSGMAVEGTITKLLALGSIVNRFFN